MSWLSSAVKKVGKGFKQLVTDPKKWAENAGRSVGGAVRDTAGFIPIPGVNAGLAALGSVAAGGNMKDHLMSAAKTAVMGPVAGKAGGMISKIPGVGSVMDKAGDVLSKIPGSGAVSDVAGSAMDRLRPLTDMVSGGATGAANAGGGGKWDNLLKIGSGVEGAYNTIQSNKYRTRALKTAEDQYNQLSPLRTQGIDMMTDQSRPDLSELYTASRSNPYARARTRPL